METVINFISMFEQSIGLKDPWKVEKAEFSEDNKAVNIYVNARKTAEYPCPECGKMCERYKDMMTKKRKEHGVMEIWFSFRASFTADDLG